MNKSNIDQPLLLSLFFLLGIGIVQVYSASYIYAIEIHGDGLYYFKRQSLFALISIITFIAAWKIPWRFIYSLSPIIWLALSGLIIMTLYSSLAVKVNGASRWLDIYGFRLQPSELLKVFLPFVWSYLLLDRNLSESKWLSLFKVVFVFTPLTLLLLQPDFGTLVVCSLAILAILFSFGLKWRYIFSLSFASSIVFFFLIWMVPYRKDRLLSFIDPWSDSLGRGFQVIQSMMSYYSGGIFGEGLGQGQGKLFFLPEAHTDFTMAVLAEETGFLGVSFIIILFAYIVFRSMQMVIRIKDSKKQCIAVGLISIFSIQVFINIGVTMGILPTKGITLPFLSYGGSSLVATALMFGFLFNAYSSDKISKTKGV